MSPAVLPLIIRPRSTDQLAEKDILHVSRFSSDSLWIPREEIDSLSTSSRSTTLEPGLHRSITDWTTTELLKESTTQPRTGSFPKETRPWRYHSSAQPAPSSRQDKRIFSCSWISSKSLCRNLRHPFFNYWAKKYFPSKSWENFSWVWFSKNMQLIFLTLVQSYTY